MQNDAATKSKYATGSHCAIIHVYLHTQKAYKNVSCLHNGHGAVVGAQAF